MIEPLRDKLIRCGWVTNFNADTLVQLIERHYASLAQPEPQGPNDEEISDLWSWAAGQDQGPWPTQQHCFARAVLARWGRPAIEPVPVAERLPGDADVNKYGQVWWFDSPEDNWILDTCEDEELETINCSRYTHWLPHHALPVPSSMSD
jgi:hypothetical protein